MKKAYVIVIILLVSGVFVFLLVSYISYIIEVKTLEDVVLKFSKAIQLKDKEVLKNITGGKIFVNLFFGDGEINESYFTELYNQFPTGAQIKFFKVFRSSELSPDERRKYGFWAWRVNVVVVDEGKQYVGGFIFYVSKISEVDENGRNVDVFKIIDIVKVGDIVF